MTANQFVHRLANGLTLVAEAMPQVQSVAMSLLVPVGAASDPPGANGASAVLADWLLRGAGSYDSRALTAYLDGLGVQRSSSAETTFMRFSATMLGKNLLKVLPIYGQILQQPHLSDEGFEPARDLAVQQLESIDDEPSHKLGLLLRIRQYPHPWNRPGVGEAQELAALTAEQVRSDYQARATPQGTILAVAGQINWPELLAAVEAAFGGWKSLPPRVLAETPALAGITHLTQPTNQVQIGLAWGALPESDPQSLLQQMALQVLSGGMGSRLFSEIREKQGLCYSVHAGYHSLKSHAAIFGYSGTAPERAQRTLDAMVVEIRRLSQGLTTQELERARTGIKSRLIMQGESSGSRAGALAYDFFHRSRPRPLEEVRGEVEKVTLSQVNAFLESHPTGPLTLVTIGPEALRPPE